VLSQDQLRELCVALGWQGGTFWQVLDEVRRMRETLKSPVAWMGTKADAWNFASSESPALAFEPEAVNNPRPLYAAASPAPKENDRA
jgi:hypothetical protein